MNNQPKYLNLIRDHTYWSDQVYTLKRASSERIRACSGDHGEHKNCIEYVYHQYGSGPGRFDFGWQQELAADRICANCIEVRELKAQRCVAARKLGRVRSLITKAGRTLGATREIQP